MLTKRENDSKNRKSDFLLKKKKKKQKMKIEKKLSKS